MRTSETGVMFNPVMDIDVGQIKDTRLVVSTQDASDLVRDEPTKRWCKVIIITDELIHLFERNVASVSGEDSCEMPKGVVSAGSSCCTHQRFRGAGMIITMISECVQGWARAPAI